MLNLQALRRPLKALGMTGLLISSVLPSIVSRDITPPTCTLCSLEFFTSSALQPAEAMSGKCLTRSPYLSAVLRAIGNSARISPRSNYWLEKEQPLIPYVMEKGWAEKISRAALEGSGENSGIRPTLESSVQFVSEFSDGQSYLELLRHLAVLAARALCGSAPRCATICTQKADQVYGLFHEDAVLHRVVLRLLQITPDKDMVGIRWELRHRALTQSEAFDLIAKYLIDQGREMVLSGRLRTLQGERRTMAEALFLALPESHPIRQANSRFSADISAANSSRLAQIEFLERAEESVPRQVKRTFRLGDHLDLEVQKMQAVGFSNTTTGNTAANQWTHLTVIFDGRVLWKQSFRRPITETPDEFIEALRAAFYKERRRIEELIPLQTQMSSEEWQSAVLEVRRGKVALKIYEPIGLEILARISQSLQMPGRLISDQNWAKIRGEFNWNNPVPKASDLRRALYIRHRLEDFTAGHPVESKPFWDGQDWLIVLPARLFNPGSSGTILTVIPKYIVSEFEDRLPKPERPKAQAPIRPVRKQFQEEGRNSPFITHRPGLQKTLELILRARRFAKSAEEKLLVKRAEEIIFPGIMPAPFGFVLQGVIYLDHKVISAWADLIKLILGENAPPQSGVQIKMALEYKTMGHEWAELILRFSSETELKKVKTLAREKGLTIKEAFDLIAQVVDEKIGEHVRANSLRKWLSDLDSADLNVAWGLLHALPEKNPLRMAVGSQYLPLEFLKKEAIKRQVKFQERAA